MKKDFLWWRDGVVYQIYPRSFADSNDDGIGDLQGIISKLPYLESLGVDAIWLSPIYPSPDVDFGYDVSNYTDIDPKFGTMADFDQLIIESQKHHIHIILDLVLNHTSDQHPWFLKSKKSKDNPYHDWYLWKDPKPNGDPPNNWRSVFGGSGWEYDPNLEKYYFHMFYKEQPDVNWRNPDLRAAMLDVFRFWLNKGVDGFRLDVFNAYFKHPNFKDNPFKFGIRPFDWQKHIYDISQPEMYPLLNEIREILDQYGETFVVGESFLIEPEQAASYCGRDKLHTAFNFEFASNRWHPKRFLNSARKWYQVLAETAWPNNTLSNHDLPRTATRYCIGEKDHRAKVAAAMLLTLKGTPFIYYGEEIGMRDIPILKKEDVKDPIGKTFWPFHKGRDGCRSPMQWNNKKNAGFSKSDPWLPVNANYNTRNVSKQLSDPLSLLNYFKNLIALRKAEPALQHGDFTPLVSNSRYIMAYLRTTNKDQVLVLLNFYSKEVNFNLPAGKWVSLLQQKTIFTNSIDLTPYQVEILKLKKQTT